ncbi:unnamed protein product [Arabidopsis arenosa]|uniref:RING-type domain-containing protein n=1 Tax=Arabidopsis arenosa TaxID=38785 RepID=A0A8S2AF98_ARAAE|nr:unnamed protein product [Arabidopsis arenosa]
MEKKRNGLRVILFPLPLQGCINPMLQLANILHSRGFSITVIHTRFNAPKASSHPLFTFLQISDGLSETQTKDGPSPNVMSLLAQINVNAESPFRDCLRKLLLESKESERVSCLIDDCGWLFTQTVAESLNLPRLVLCTFKASFFNAYPSLPLIRTKGYFPVSDSEAEDSVPEFPPLQKRDISKVFGEFGEKLDPFLHAVVETTMSSSGLIFMSCEELEKDSLTIANEIFKVPIFAIGPFHSYFSASSSSLFTQDETCIPWLGCINPMLQLAKILYSRGFSITIIHTRFNAPKSSNHPLFTFLQIPDGLSESQTQSRDVLLQLTLLNNNCENPFRECLAKLIKLSSDSGTEERKISCLIDDSGWVFTQSVSGSFNLPRFVLCAYKFSFFLGHLLVPQIRREGFLPVPDSEAEDLVLAFPPLRKKDLVRIMGTSAQSKPLDSYLQKILEATKPASGLIVMSCEELDQDSLAESKKRRRKKGSMEKSNGLRVIVFPLPLQGCINPMIQLAKILHSRGFSITVIHTCFNAPKASNHPLFTFLEIPDGLSETEKRTNNTKLLLTLLNRNCESPFRDCLTKLLQSADSETGEEKQRICCLIDDSGWMFTQPIAQSLKLPRLVLSVFTVSFYRSQFVLPKLRREVYLPLQDSEQDDLVQEFPPLRKKDILRMLDVETEILDPFLDKVLKMTKASSGLIFMSCEELDQDSHSLRYQEIYIWTESQKEKALMDKSNGLRVILFPLPLQGCINPMIQLAKILHSRGFSITVIHTRFNAPKASSHPLFTFLEIPDGLSETETSTHDVTLLLTLLNRNCESPFRDCLTKLLQSADSETGEEKQRICCLIDDSGWMFTQPIAQSLKLPRLVLSTYKLSFFRSHFVLPQLRSEMYLPLQDSEQDDDPVQEFPPLRKKDLLQILDKETEILDSYMKMILETTKASSGLIFVSSCEELDQDSLSQAREDFQVPIFTIGPSHSYFPGSSSSLFTVDDTCIPWYATFNDGSRGTNLSFQRQLPPPQPPMCPRQIEAMIKDIVVDVELCCPICLEDLKKVDDNNGRDDDDKVVVCLSKCNHSFHMNCIFSWLRQSQDCPICRSSVYRGEVTLINNGVGLGDQAL